MEYGQQYVLLTGMQHMQVSFVDSWDTHNMVGI